MTSDVLLAALCAIVALVLLAGYWLPQTPAGGTADALAYGQWQTHAHAAAGVAYDVAFTLGLFSVAQAFWLRLLMAVLVAVLLLRLTDRVARLFAARRPGDALRDEERVRVSDRAPALPNLAAQLRARRYRVVMPADPDSAEMGWLVGDRAPWAEIGSVVLHLGLLIVVAGVLVNSILGWDVTRQQLDADAAGPVTLARGNLSLQLVNIDPNQRNAQLRLRGVAEPVVLILGQTVSAPWISSAVGSLPAPCCLSLRLTEVTPGFRVSAVNAAGTPLTITASSYANPAPEVLLTLRRDEPGRLAAIEASRLAVLISEDNGGRVQVYGVPSGNLITDTAIQPSLVISNTTLQFKPTLSAAVAAQYRPGDLLLWAGCAGALLGLLGALLWPMQRLIVRRHAHWTEFYASGRGVRRVVRELLQH
jgi:hypothetical protein